MYLEGPILEAIVAHTTAYMESKDIAAHGGNIEDIMLSSLPCGGHVAIKSDTQERKYLGGVSHISTHNLYINLLIWLSTILLS